MRAYGRILWLVMVLAAAGCAVNPKPAPPDSEQAVEGWPILWQRAGQRCRLTGPTRMVIRDVADLAALPIGEVPVDLDSQMVLLVGLGEVPTGGYAIRITGVRRQGQRLIVDVRSTAPPPGVARPLDRHSPYHVVVIPRSDLNVDRFVVGPQADPRGDNPYR